MATAVSITFSEVTGTPVAWAFTRLLDRFTALIEIERDPLRGRTNADHDRYCDAVEAAHASLMDAAADVLAEDVESEFDGPLRRLALITELQMSIECPCERRHLFQTIQHNRDVFDIAGCSRAAQNVRDMQETFFTLYAALVEGPGLAQPFIVPMEADGPDLIPA